MRTILVKVCVLNISKIVFISKVNFIKDHFCEINEQSRILKDGSPSMNEAEIDEVEDVVVGPIDQHKVGALRQMQRGWMHLLAEQVLHHQVLGHPQQTLKFLMEDVGEAVGVRIVVELIK